MRKRAASNLLSRPRRAVGSIRGFRRTEKRRALDAAEAAGFDVLLTVDQGFGHQQNLAGRTLAVVIFRTKSIALEDLLPHVPACLLALQGIKPGDTVEIPGAAQ